MHVTSSSVALASTHSAHRVATQQVTTEIDFRSLLGGLSASGETFGANEEAQFRSVLVDMVQAILKALRGETGSENIAGGKQLTVAGAEPLAETRGETGGELSGEMSGETVLRRTTHSRIDESERLMVAGKGQVCTADGRQLDFTLDLAMARHFEGEKIAIDEQRIRLRDPLVLSFPGVAASLQGRQIDFDLNADGVCERIPGLGDGCGFLVFDRNANGRVDNGRELFGAITGNGFNELRQLDSDLNGWIDGGDAVWSALGLWDGRRGIVPLTASGIGALGTTSIDAPFSLTTDDNALLGKLREIGVYLMESGQVGCVQQIDLVADSVLAPAQQQPGQREGLEYK